MKQEIEESGDRVPMVDCWTRADQTHTLRVCYRSGPQELVMLLVTGCHIQLPTSATHKGAQGLYWSWSRWAWLGANQ